MSADGAPERLARRNDALSALKDQVHRDYLVRTPESRALFQRASTAMPGGVSGNLRAYDPYPLYMTHGRGARSFDLDRNEYIDCFLGNGPLLLGHNHPDLVEALKDKRNKGSLIYNPEFLVETAELVKEVVPGAERVRFVNSGTEAVMTAVRLARAYTGRPKVVKFRGHYHGQDDQFLIGRGGSDQPSSAGVPRESLANTVLLPFNDIAAVEARVAGAHDVAAVILDPAMNSGGLWGAERGYVQQLRQLTRERGVVLIFDEVITGFRLALGGAQEHYGVVADLATYAKAIAAGEKLAAVTGLADIMNLLSPQQSGGGGQRPSVFQSGTMNDGTTALAAAAGALRIYRKLNEYGAYTRLNQLALRLGRGIEAAFVQHSLPCHVNVYGSMAQIFITSRKPSFDVCSGLDGTVASLFLLGMINHGIFLSVPSSGHIYLSFAHTDDDVAKILSAIAANLNRYPFREAIDASM